MNLNYIFY